ncbi:MAG: TOMM precursor leader peptide-binding protein [Ktedonobacteraceae bacterium]|nr:TOMM precursor leader peptide-binding protein [Ktedonobacteraceae bacterium]
MGEPIHALSRPVHIISVGAFGNAVAAALKELLPDVLQTGVDAQNQAYPASWPIARVNILASWRPVPALQQLIDGISFAWKRPSITVVLNAPYLLIGPVVVPGISACYNCYERRFLQHSARQEVYRSLQAHYDQYPESGPQGYLPSLVHIAALRLAQNILQLDEDASKIAGQIWHMNTLTRYTFTARVVGVHACPRCGLRRDEATRSYLDMQKELADIFYQTGGNGLYQPVLEEPGAEAIAMPARMSMNGHGGKTC